MSPIRATCFAHLVLLAPTCKQKLIISYPFYIEGLLNEKPRKDLIRSVCSNLNVMHFLVTIVLQWKEFNI